MAEEAPTGTAGTKDDAPVTAPTAAEGKTFSQDELDRIVGDRVAREKAKIADYDDLKAKAARLDELEAANATELDKANARAEKAEARAEAAETKLSTTLIRSAVVQEAAEAGALAPGDVHTLLSADPAFAEMKGKLTIGDDGQVSGAKEAVEAVLTARQHLVGSTRPGPGDGGARAAAAPSAGPAGDAEAAHTQLVAGLFGGPQ